MGEEQMSQKARCRHYTTQEGLEGIKRDKVIKPSRGEPGTGVDVEVEPFGSASPIPAHRSPGAEVGAGTQLSTSLASRYIEFDLPEGSIPTPWVSETRNTARIPTGLAGLPIKDLNPRFVIVRWWQFWKW
jgi:hypothetical protein